MKSRRIFATALFLVLLLPLVNRTEGQHPEVILKNEIAETMAELTLSYGVPLKPVFPIPEEKVDDLIRKGIMKVYRDGSGEINLYEALIEVEEDPISYLREMRMNEYAHASMVTVEEDGTPIYEFTEHSCAVEIPDYCNLYGETSFNLYNTHLVFPDGHFIESGVGWFGPEAQRETEGLNLYTYESFNGNFSFKRIPEGRREIHLSVVIDNYDNCYRMLAEDPYPYSGRFVSKEMYNPGYYSGRVDQCQEQHSRQSFWSPTDQARLHGGKLYQDEQPMDWDYGIPTQFWQMPPMHLQREEYDGKISIVTWCE
ncbi:MAG: hypothetical protein SVE93_01295 [Candidatus Thermoplasmatota archaeon]|nr:hypothetical protein [Candidatus Thermoplasmatota archaeon]